jgi:hypothetical protein
LYSLPLLFAHRVINSLSRRATSWKLIHRPPCSQKSRRWKKKTKREERTGSSSACYRGQEVLSHRPPPRVRGSEGSKRRVSQRAQMLRSEQSCLRAGCRCSLCTPWLAAPPSGSLPTPSGSTRSPSPVPFGPRNERDYKRRAAEGTPTWIITSSHICLSRSMP